MNFSSKYNWSKSCLRKPSSFYYLIELLQCVKFIFVKISSVYVSNNLIIYNTTRKTSALISCWCGGKRRQEKSSCTHIKQRWCCSLWTKTKNLVRKLFTMKSSWDICFLHTAGIFRHQESQDLFLKRNNEVSKGQIKGRISWKTAPDSSILITVCCRSNKKKLLQQTN